MYSDSPNPLTPYLTVNEVAEQLRVSRSFVYGLVASGRLRAVRIGKGRGAIRVAQADLIAYVHRNSTVVREAADVQPRPTERLRHIRL